MQEAKVSAAKKAHLEQLQNQVEEKKRQRREGKQAAMAEGRLLKERLAHEKAEIEVTLHLPRRST